MPIDAALGLAFLDIEVAFEIVVLCLFGDLSKRAQSNWDRTVLGPSASAEGNKTNMGASEIDPGGIGHSIEIRRAVKPRIGKIGRPLKEAVERARQSSRGLIDRISMSVPSSAQSPRN